MGGHGWTSKGQVSKKIRKGYVSGIMQEYLTPCKNFRQKKNNLISIIILIRCNLASKYQTESVNNTLIKISDSVRGLIS